MPPSGPSSTPVDLQPDQLHRFATSLRELGSARPVDQALQLSVDLATELIRTVDIADIMFVRGGQVTTPVSTHEVAKAVDQAQQEAGEGPCLSAVHEGDDVVVRDLEDDDRWPKFRSRGLDLGVRSVAAFRLFVERENRVDNLGALNLFGRRPGIDDVSVELGRVFAAHCATVLNAAIEEEGLQIALQSRDIIGQAKGILMERHRMTADQAYDLLRRTSNNLNIKLRDLAQTVAATGALPE